MILLLQEEKKKSKKICVKASFTVIERKRTIPFSKYPLKDSASHKWSSLEER